jgi:hypothetical protein
VQKGVKQGCCALLFGSDADVRVPKKSEEDQPYYEWQPDGQGNTVQVRIFTKTEMVAFAKENIQAFVDLLLSMDTSTPMGKVAFDIVMGTKCPDYPNGKCQTGNGTLETEICPNYSFCTIYNI